MSDSNTQPLTPEQQEALQAQNEMVGAINEQYEQIKWQATALTHDTAKVDLEGLGGVQVGPNAYELKSSGYTPEPAPEDLAALKAKQAWQNLVSVFTPEPTPHEHGPFTWLLNANHNALRGCKTCGQTWTGLMSGVQESDLRWHEVQEVPEEEE